MRSQTANSRKKRLNKKQLPVNSLSCIPEVDSISIHYKVHSRQYPVRHEPVDSSSKYFIKVTETEGNVEYSESFSADPNILGLVIISAALGVAITR